METPTTTAVLALCEGERRKVLGSALLRGSNPRKKFDPAYMAWLKGSIKAQGILHDPLVRLMPDGSLKLVAGACRITSWMDLHGDVPLWVLVKTMTDEEATAAAATENIVRKPMTPVEEAEAAAQTLADCGGDRAEAARFLGWPPSTLDGRLALMYATQSVRDALQADKIRVGHAELLASCRKEAQEQGLKFLLEQERPMTVADFKAFLERAALVLTSAIFDKTDCAGCQHNSDLQAALFGEAITGGKCTNKKCFEEKTEQELEKRAVTLRDDFQVVRIVRAGEHLTMVKLQAEGPRGVGAEQAQACRTCKSFGAVVSAVPDKLGNTYRDMCMDVGCNARKVAAIHAPADAAAGVEPTKRGSNAGAGKPEGPKNSDKAGSKESSKPKASSEPTGRVKEFREKLWRTIFTKVVSNLDVPGNRSVLLALCVTRPSALDRTALADALDTTVTIKAVYGPGQALRAILKLEQKSLAEAVHRIAAHVGSGQTGLEIKDVTSILDAFDTKIADHWKVDKAFLELLTKNEIEAVAQELGAKKAMGADFAKARNGSKPDFIAAVLAAPNFDFTGRIPKLVTW